MELNNIEKIYIYDYIKEYLSEISIIKVKKGEYITHSSANIEEIFFILDGRVKVECITRSGRSILVDEVSKNDFVGKISYMYEENLFCDITARTNVTLLKIAKGTFKKLENNPDFLKIFLFKTSKRIYYMYKKLMIKDLFKFEEIFAYHILKNSENDVFKFKSMYNLCEILSVSRKNLYNVVNCLIQKKYIQKESDSIIIINRCAMDKLAAGVKEVSEINESDFKINI
ncbi:MULTISPECIES: Crp/Fnr family transcriptional regulator [Clostridium]|uniref:Cyclic nucleotide-binding protein n=3 Tax=Clostridium TaxID=1485 RepID=A0AAV3W6M3_9CLOT|nr:MULTISPECIES: Crp/Fnr family transcriptional regulator [Clostridium]NRY63227.1 CRP-like cAMP-binding protein [Clostridium beijerinckii]OOM58696.1 DNA-binding transcriptional activator YeiL [Clostridium beijerinckii]QES73419.1 Crp/Fnr family transcriptional regulator [Clostridium diolis]GEA33675.1 cyclic nucleotide-binding protein [Clostridium diolis]